MLGAVASSCPDLVLHMRSLGAAQKSLEVRQSPFCREARAHSARVHQAPGGHPGCPRAGGGAVQTGGSVCCWRSLRARLLVGRGHRGRSQTRPVWPGGSPDMETSAPLATYRSRSKGMRMSSGVSYEHSPGNHLVPQACPGSRCQLPHGRARNRGFGPSSRFDVDWPWPRVCRIPVGLFLTPRALALGPRRCGRRWRLSPGAPGPGSRPGSCALPAAPAGWGEAPAGGPVGGPTQTRPEAPASPRPAGHPLAWARLRVGRARASGRTCGFCRGGRGVRAGPGRRAGEGRPTCAFCAPQPRSSAWGTRCWGWPRSACR